MASINTASSQLIDLLKKSKPSALTASQNGDDYSVAELIKSSFPDVDYSDSEKAELSQWLITSNHVASPDEDQAKTSDRLSSLNTHLSTRTTVLGSKPSLADVSLYARLAPIVAKWSGEERTGEQGYHHIVRHLDFVQNASMFDLDIKPEDKVNVNADDVVSAIKPIDPKAEKERKKREKEAQAAASGTSTPTANGDSAGKENVSGGGRKAKKEAKQQAKSTGDIVAAAVGSETAGVAQPSAGVAAKEEGNAATPVPEASAATPVPEASAATPVPEASAATPVPEASAATPVQEASAQPATVKKEKKAKQPKQPAPPPQAAPLSPCLIDLRVGHILKAIAHPNADSLYVSTIACGDAPGTDNTSEYEGQVVRTVCSGLNGLIPLEEMQNRKIIAVCNLKPVTMRGIKSAAMVLAASPRIKEGEVDDHKGPVELVNPPSDSKAGDRVYFEGWEGEPEGVLNPKKKIWEMCQVGFTTTDAKEVAFDAGAVKELEGKEGLGLLRTKAGLCSVPNLTGATVR